MILFSKYHGCGNNFVIVKESELLKHVSEKEYPDMAVKACDVNTGIGADGMIVVRQEPATEMVFFNRDGSRAPMCGNGIRCFAHFCRDEGIVTGGEYPVKTLAGDMIVDITSQEPFRVRINMGSPVFTKEAVNADIEDDDFPEGDIVLHDGSKYRIISMFMGTIHTVVFTEKLDPEEIESVGRQICNHPVFREKTNVNFVKVIDDETMEVRTYERGVGVTLACGTGACASVVAANMKGLCQKSAQVRLEMGSLNIDISDDGNVYMEGPSVRIMTGELC